MLAEQQQLNYARNSNLTTFTLPLVNGLDTEAKINIAYNEAHASSPNQSWYRRLMNHGAAHATLGGGRYYLEGYKENANYGWQRATSYSTAQDTLPYKCCERSLINGTWSAWQKAPTRAEIDALTAKAGVILRKTVTINSLTVGSGGYTSIESYYPGSQAGYAFLMCEVHNVGTVSTKDSVTVTGNGSYIIGTAGAIITNLQLAYIYVPLVKTE